MRELFMSIVVLLGTVIGAQMKNYSQFPSKQQISPTGYPKAGITPEVPFDYPRDQISITPDVTNVYLPTEINKAAAHSNENQHNSKEASSSSDADDSVIAVSFSFDKVPVTNEAPELDQLAYSSGHLQFAHRGSSGMSKSERSHHRQNTSFP